MNETVKAGQVQPTATRWLRELFDHRVNRANDALTLRVIDGPGQGNACHHYEVTGFEEAEQDSGTLSIHFQNGPIKEHGVNGITQEVLITICIDRLRSFQAGQYKCRENAIALTHLEDALMWLQKRTRDRMARGVEGTNVL